MEYKKCSILLLPIVLSFTSLFYSTSGCAAVLYPIGTYNSTGSSVSIVKTNYTPPSGAKYVATSGSDSTGIGSLSKPWRTIAKAIASTPSGGTIVIRGGSYHESVRIIDKRLTLQPYPGEAVWFKGSSTITSWVKESSTVWRNDNYTFKSNHNRPTNYLRDPYPYPDVVLVNGVGLEQVYSRSAMAAGKFYIDQAHSKLYIGTNPSSKTVEAATLEQALYVCNINSNNGADGSIIRGIGFKHYATFMDDGGAVTINSANVQILDCTFAWNGGRGLKVYTNANGVIRHNTMVFNGEIGLNGNSSDRLLVERNAVAYNTRKPWSTSWNAAGSKFSKAKDMVFRDNLFEHNNGKGLWCDESVLNAKIVRNIMRYNQMGIQFEISAGAVIASNVIYNSTNRGILISNSGNSSTMKMYVYNNTFFNNQGGDIRTYETSRVNTDSKGLSEGITFNVTGVQVKNNLIVNSMAPQAVSSEDISNTKSSSQMIESMDYNGYWRRSTTTTKTMVLWTKHAGGSPIQYATVPSYKSSNVPYESHALVYDLTSTDPFFNNAAGADFRLKCGSKAIRAGTSLPSQVASALGVSTGVNQNLGALIGVASCTTNSTTSLSDPDSSLSDPDSLAAPSSIDGTVVESSTEGTTESTVTDNRAPEVDLTSIEASADSYVGDGSTAATNYGSEPVLAVKTARAGLSRIAYLNFNIGQISGRIENAKLRVYAALDKEGAVESELFGVPDESWTEASLTWDNHPGVSVNLGRMLIEGSTYQIYEVDLSDYIKQEKAAGSQSVSIAFSNPEASTIQIMMNAREAEDNAPELVIETSD